MPRFSLKVFLVLEKKIFRCFFCFVFFFVFFFLFYHMLTWRPSCLMVWNHLNKLSISLMKSMKIGRVVSEKKMFKDYMILNMYIAKGQGRITAKRQNFDCN